MENKITDAEMQELNALREEKRKHVQTERACGALKNAGIPQAFAALLIGADDTDTDERVTSFCRTYQETLTQDIRKRLPAEAPVLTSPQPARPRRGIVRVR